jgi:hypothetical protein
LRPIVADDQQMEAMVREADRRTSSMAEKGKVEGLRP